MPSLSAIFRRLTAPPIFGAFLGALIGWLFDASPARVAVCALIGAMIGISRVRSDREWGVVPEQAKKRVDIAPPIFGALLGTLIGWLFDASSARVAVCALIGAVIGIAQVRSDREWRKIFEQRKKRLEQERKREEQEAKIARWREIRDSVRKATRDAKTAGLRVTPLHAAARMNDPAVVAVLVKRGGDPNAQNSNGWTPLHYAQHYSAQSAYNALVKCGADESIPNKDGESPKDWKMKKLQDCGRSVPTPILDHEQARRRTPARW